MEHKRPPLRAIIAGVLVLAVAGYYGLRALNGNKNATLQASGTIEAVTVSLSPEMAGKVAEVLVDEGQAVKQGDPLLRLDDSLLRAQRSVSSAALDSARSALATAQTNYDLALQNALTAEQESTDGSWRVSAPDEFNQPAWYFEKPVQLASAQAEVEAAQKSLDEARAALEQVINDLSNAEFLKAEKRLADARAAFLVAKDVKTSADFAAEGGSLQKAADEAYNQALAELNAAQRDYNKLLGSKGRLTVLNARGRLIVAQQRYDAAHARLLALQTGLESPAVTIAQKALDQATSGAGQAEANLALLDTQLTKLTVVAPMDGVILTRNVEPGEFVQPGSSALIMANLEQLTITVYVPEDRYGQISRGQAAIVQVDSFPGETFSAEVIHIAEQAEFTPRNVQTVEGRSSTVFAVKLKVSDPGGKLKIGMPADVTFTR
jgi:HlyD family secretion protein